MLDFFNPQDAQCLVTSAKRMYLYDGSGSSPAILSATLLQSHPVVVENPTGLRYVFRPVDKVVYGPTDAKRGDVLIHSVDRLQLVFAELKIWRVCLQSVSFALCLFVRGRDSGFQARNPLCPSSGGSHQDLVMNSTVRSRSKSNNRNNRTMKKLMLLGGIRYLLPVIEAAHKLGV